MPRRDAIGLLLVLLSGGLTFGLGISWGLPGRWADPFLFGDRSPWTGAEITALTGGRPADAGLGADVDRNPVPGGAAGPFGLNDTDAQRAEIVRRYRLYSAQPDEMITFMALSGMRPGKLELDPKLYQYGGLWIYPVGAAVAAGGKLGLLEVRNDATFYLDHPEAFGRFYVVARVYSAAWGLLGAAAVWWLVRRLTGSGVVAAVAGIGFCLLPVVVNMAHEAKPHLAGTVLMLLAAMAAGRFVESGRTGWWVSASALCGAAGGMILSALVGVVVLPLMVLLRRGLTWPRRAIILFAGVLIAVDVYLATNPYVLKHLLQWPRPDNPLRSNVANSKAMYAATDLPQAATDAVRLLGYAATPVVIVLGTVGLAVLLLQKRSDAEGHDHRKPYLLLLAVPAGVVLVQFVLLAAGKPGEYARFALFPAAVLLIGMSVWVGGAVRRDRVAAMILAGLVGLFVAPAGVSYVWHFVVDASDRPTRMKIAERLRDAPPPAGVIVLPADPAPYNLPPVDLFRTRLVLRRPAEPEPGAIALLPVDAPPRNLRRPTGDGSLAATVHMRPRLLTTPISWAGKTFVAWSLHPGDPSTTRKTPDP